MSRPLPVFTIQTFNQNALQPAGAVFAQRVESISIARNFFAGLGGVVGGRSTMMEKKMNDLTTVLMEELDIQAKKLYPNAVALVNVNVHFSDICKSDSSMFLAGQASATAIIKRVKAVGQSMVTSSQPVAPLVPAPAPAQMSAPAPAQMSAPASAQMSAPAPAPAPVPIQMPPLAIPSSANSQPIQNTKLMGIPKAISGGKSKRKSFISKSRTIKGNRKHK
jgi:uncharacterized protein YbjQ (UPF0145 family)